MLFDAGVYKRHLACRSLDLDRRCGSGGVGWQRDWERVRLGVDRGRRRRVRLDRTGRRWGFGIGVVRKGLGELFWGHCWRWKTLGRSIDVGEHCYENLPSTVLDQCEDRQSRADEANILKRRS